MQLDNAAGRRGFAESCLREQARHMGDVVNLRRFRKRAHKASAATEAAGNRARFGRTREQAASDTAQAERAARVLDGARLDQPGIANREKERDTSA